MCRRKSRHQTLRTHRFARSAGKTDCGFSRLLPAREVLPASGSAEATLCRPLPNFQASTSARRDDVSIGRSSDIQNDRCCIPTFLQFSGRFQVNDGGAEDRQFAAAIPETTGSTQAPAVTMILSACRHSPAWTTQLARLPRRLA